MDNTEDSTVNRREEDCLTHVDGNNHDLTSDSSLPVQIKEIQMQMSDTVPVESKPRLDGKNLQTENAELLADIVRLCEISDPKNTEVILLLGKTGAGKSAIVNTIYNVLTGNYHKIAKQGAGKAQSVTMEVNRFDNCGISKQTLAAIKDETRRDTISTILPNLPHIIDCAGLGDENSPAIREILELLVGGYIPPDTLIEAMQEKQKELGVGSLKLIFPEASQALKVSKIVFVQSATDSMPKNLLECLTSVLRAMDRAKMKRKYTAEIFLVITKFDLVRDNNLSLKLSGDYEPYDEKDHLMLDIDQFKIFEKDLAYELNMIGALDMDTIRWISFTDRITEDNLCINFNALKFLRRMIEPSPTKNKFESLVLPFSKYIAIYIYMFVKNIRNAIQLALIVAIIVVVIGVLFMLLTARI
ncbi:uncharacterized protein LOC132714935 [Ruditapes philippinarum]|uniref:uncharacterized protein LOC132714935 n=1 Tax=Ruditapes philippinarum TaxID=129788 RepID=UPI00295B0783|nr:uncharacterized protein LOC132714935 [Ruditapes philippinarum]